MYFTSKTKLSFSKALHYLFWIAVILANCPSWHHIYIHLYSPSRW